ncbi:MAG: hypothetical protein E2P06_01045 [Acidobacteria bacterium]|nr:MAG: hypothetical protein E2P06_01045 [Acidobacteriota bacterium]
MSVTRRSVTALFAVLLLAPLAPMTAAAQSTTEAPRTPWDTSDLNGVWDFRTLTPLERPEQYGDREFLTEEEARALQQGAVDQNQAADAAPANRTEAGGSIGAYNRFWMDFGTQVVANRRTSLIVDPPNGRRPPRTADVRTRYSTPGSFGSAPLEQIEDLSYFDRCLGTAGLPIYPTAYNNNVQIFQTEHHLVMLVEMLNTTRIIPLTDRPHGEIRQWLGDSRTHWEGATLVVETTNFDRWLHLVGGSRDAHLVERLTRVSPDVIEYEYTIEDASVWTAPWTAVQTLRKNPLPIFEYACHEGNYAAGNMLAGARLDEAAKAGR